MSSKSKRRNEEIKASRKTYFLKGMALGSTLTAAVIGGGAYYQLTKPPEEFHLSFHRFDFNGDGIPDTFLEYSEKKWPFKIWRGELRISYKDGSGIKYLLEKVERDSERHKLIKSKIPIYNKSKRRVVPFRRNNPYQRT